MNIKSANTLKYADASNTTIDMMIDVDGLGLIPFTASATDSEPHGRAMHASALAGTFGPIAPFVPKVKTQPEIDAEVSAVSIANLAKLRADTFPDVLAFLATLPGAPKVLKDAATLAALEKGKIK